MQFAFQRIKKGGVLLSSIAFFVRYVWSFFARISVHLHCTYTSYMYKHKETGLVNKCLYKYLIELDCEEICWHQRSLTFLERLLVHYVVSVASLLVRNRLIK